MFNAISRNEEFARAAKVLETRLVDLEAEWTVLQDHPAWFMVSDLREYELTYLSFGNSYLTRAEAVEFFGEAVISGCEDTLTNRAQECELEDAA